MIENKEMVYCMAKLEDEIRAEYKSAAIYLDCKCEGCVNWPCVGVCGLTEHLERY